MDFPHLLDIEILRADMTRNTRLKERMKDTAEFNKYLKDSL